MILAKRIEKFLIIESYNFRLVMLLLLDIKCKNQTLLVRLIFLKYITQRNMVTSILTLDK